MHEVISDLRTESDTGFIFVVISVFGFPLFFFDPRQRRAKHLPSLRPVLVLAALALALNHDSGRNMRQPYRTIGRVDVLTTGALGTISIGTNFGLIDVDVHRIGNLRRHIDSRETGLSLAL